MAQESARKSKGRPSERTLAVQVHFEGGEDVPILFANHIFIRNTPDGFLVSFAQSHGPYIVHPTPEDMQRNGVAARIITRLMIPPNRMREFVDLLQRMLTEAERPTEE